MKVLWIVNHKIPHLAKFKKEKLPKSGTWLIEVFNIISVNQNIDLVIICPSTKNEKIIVDRVTYYLIEMSKIDLYLRATKKLESKIDLVMKEVIPDIIHIHGTEFPFNQSFLKYTSTPKLISIQGLISQISLKKYSFAGMNDSSLFSVSWYNYLSIYAPIFIKNKINSYRAHSEVFQLKNCNNVIGRTNWDKAHSQYLNKSVNYFYLKETIRNTFINRFWNQDEFIPNSIFCPSGFANPIKGAHKVLEALFILKKDFKNISLKIPGENIMLQSSLWGYKLYLKKLIQKLDLEDNIIFLGVLNDEDMCKQYCVNNLTLLGSSIENSSNSLAEALAVGAPTVAPFVGGLTSLVTDEKDVLFYPFNDTVFMAWQIKRLLCDRNFAISLNANLNRKKIKDNYNNEVVDGLINIYSKIVSQK
jgi:glycosyltransferase involved in cell wall biosynthesis